MKFKKLFEYLSIIIFLLYSVQSFGQTKEEIKIIFLKISKEDKNTKQIGSNKNILNLSKNKKNSIKFLIEEFTDKKETNIYSYCLERNINLGELAIILVDKLKSMNYSKLTGIKNAEEQSKKYCKSGNVIEFFLNQINNEGGGVQDFKDFYKQDYLKNENK